MKNILAIALLLVVGAKASATEFSGSTIFGSSCTVTVSEEVNSKVTVDTDFVTLATHGSTATKTSENEYSFSDIMIQSSGPLTYRPVIGAPITIGGVGVIAWKGKLTLGAKPSLTAMGTGSGVWSWWKQSFTCKNLTVVQK